MTRMRAAKFANDYKEEAIRLANLIGKFEQIYDRLQYIDTEEAGNYFPSSAAGEAFKPLACALANTVVYWHDYEKEASGESSGEVAVESSEEDDSKDYTHGVEE